MADSNDQGAKSAKSAEGAGGTSEGKFVLAYTDPNKFTLVAISKSESLLLNHNNEEIDCAMAPGGKLKANTSAELKKVYDSGEHHSHWVKPPKGYKAPWQQ